MLKKTIRRLSALAMVLAMAVSVFAVNASANNTEVLPAVSKKITKSTNTYVPTTDFTFSITAAGQSDTIGTNPGVDGVISIDPVHFEANANDIGVAEVNGTGGTIRVDATKFTHPGIYYYNVTEVNSAVSGVTYDPQTKKLAVYKYKNGTIAYMFVKEETKEDGTKETVEVEPEKKKVKILKRPVSISDTTPLWTKHPNECTEEEYREFYHKVFLDYKEPLFWIHLNMDYPFNLKGILYFPKINTEYESIEGTIKLYNNQVFIADNIKEVIPEFLMLLKGVIDCPDLPLNVSRSALQNDGFVKKISDYITKKVADKLSGMCKTDKEEYEKYWDDISPFIKFGCLKDTKFCEKMSDYVLFKNLDDKYLTFKECLEENKDKHENTIFYTNDPVQQSQYVNMFKAEGIDAVVLKDAIDQPFISQLEQKNENVKFVRIDADLNDSFTEEISEDELKDATEKLTETFKKALNRDQLDVKVQKIKDEKVSSMITVSEESRRMQDMMKMYGMSGMDPAMFGGSGETLVLNANNALVKYILANPEGENTDIMCKQLYDLAVISHTPLNPESMTAFIERSNKILEILSEK